MIELIKSFEIAISDLQTIDWSESDGSDVNKILIDYFSDYSDKKAEINGLFSRETSLNKFQKSVIQMKLDMLFA